MVSMLEEVLRSGTAAGVRARGFAVPAAGKTGTSHDGWFAGFTSQLLCIVWVGFDDNSELGLEGAHSALPIWTQFMKQALAYRTYRDAKPFTAPDGIVTMQVDSTNGEPATPYSEHTVAEVFIAGTEPVGAGPTTLSNGDTTNVAGWNTAAPSNTAARLPPLRTDPLPAPAPTDRDGQPPDSHAQTQPAKRGFWKKLFGAGKPKPPA